MLRSKRIFYRVFTIEFSIKPFVMHLQVHLHRQNQLNLLRSSLRTMLRRQKIHATPFSRGMHQILMVRSLP